MQRNNFNSQRSTRASTGGRIRWPLLSADSRFDALLPVMHLRHAFDPKGRDVLRLSLSRSLRVPNVNPLLPRYTLNGTYPREQSNMPLAPDSAGNPALQPEFVTGLELALERQPNGGGVLGAGLFHRQIDDPNARIEGQVPWGTTMGFDHALRGSIFSCGANLVVTPAFSTQQTDRQRVWRSHPRRLDAYALWRFSKEAELRLPANNLVPEDSLSSSRVEDLDGFGASSLSRRDTITLFSVNLAVRL